MRIGLHIFRDPDVQMLTFVAAVVGCLIFGSVAWYKVEAHRSELIAAGLCKVETTQLYQPPPVWHCSFRDSKTNMCITQYVTQADPYYRDLWKCPEETAFWRRKQGY